MRCRALVCLSLAVVCVSCSALVPGMVAAKPEHQAAQVLSGGASAGVFEAVAWGFAIVVGALALAFVARLLNGRKPLDRGV